MTTLLIIIQLLGATMLLLYAVRMVRTGIERAFGASFRPMVASASGIFRAPAYGFGLAIVLQSSAAVILLAAGLAEMQALGMAAGLRVALGADLGSALLIEFLSYRTDWLVPLLLAVGGASFGRQNSHHFKQLGRILIGIALVLVALGFLREAVEPIRNSGILPALVAQFERDFLTAFVVGAVLAFVMHSSVATILMIVTLVAIEAVPIEAAISLVLGANLGSAFIPLWLSRNMSPAAKRIPVGNLVMRGSAAIAAVFIVNQWPVLPYVSAQNDAQTVINAHIAFNAMLLLFVPFCGLLDAPLRQFLPDPVGEAEDHFGRPRSALDDTVVSNPALALASLRREVLRMLQIVEGMFTPVMDAYQTGDKTVIDRIASEDLFVNSALNDVRRYVASIPSDVMKKENHKVARELTEYAISLESAGDVIAKQLLPLAQQMNEQNIKFSEAGEAELISMHDQVKANLNLAANVMVSSDIGSARLLMQEKTAMAQFERFSRKKHLRRLRDGGVVSFDSSDLHLETLRSLKEFNSHISSVAYPILYRGGQLLDTRLVEGDTEVGNAG